MPQMLGSITGRGVDSTVPLLQAEDTGPEAYRVSLTRPHQLPCRLWSASWDTCSA